MKNYQNVNLTSSIRLDVYKIIDDVVARAVQYGYNRAHKHVEAPTEEHMVQEIHKAVMNDLCEILKFDEET
jgi:hypothetical protein